ncbi:hypothetical protein [Parabacteroides pacaensis]|uniref:hypothetical protein n=1 Tax=Parabacteroides pacaensis TaxID=2086575 RepID=UPI00131D9FA7|nr:hypothetical protein [Parabacteroides pacaensis]
MKNTVQKNSANPIMTSDNLQLADSDMEIACLLNLGAFIPDECIQEICNVELNQNIWQ